MQRYLSYEHKKMIHQILIIPIFSFKVSKIYIYAFEYIEILIVKFNSLHISSQTYNFRKNI